MENFFLFLIEEKINFYKKFENIKKSSKFFRALEFSILENLGHCRKTNLDSYYNELTRGEVKILKEIGLKKGIIFFFFIRKIQTNLDKC